MSEWVVRPQDFIGGPFSECPRCHAPQLGLLSVHRHHYVKRCRACVAAHSADLPPVAKAVVYLDQLALSNMMFALNPNTPQFQAGRVEPFWRAAFERLDVLVKLQRIVCPQSSTHWFESMVSPHARELDDLARLLSMGVRFQPVPVLRRFQVQRHARQWLAGAGEEEVVLERREVLDGNALDGWTDRMQIVVRSHWTAGQLEDIRAARDQTHAGIVRIFQRWQTESSRKFQDWYAEELDGFGKRIRGEFLRLVASGPLAVLNMSDDAMVPLMIQRDFEFGGLSDDEAWDRLHAFLQTVQWDRLPVARLGAMLWASLARKAASGMKTPPTTGVVHDIETLAAILPHCDAIFLDNEMRAYLQEQPLRDAVARYGTQVFSMSTKDGFLAYLDDLRAQVPDDHVRLVHTVYGADWPTPFTGLYDQHD